MGYEQFLTPRGFALIEFADRNGVKCNIQESSIADEDCIWFGCQDADPKKLVPGEGWISVNIPENILLNTRMHLSREQVNELLPILTYFVETGMVGFPMKRMEKNNEQLDQCIWIKTQDGKYINWQTSCGHILYDSFMNPFDREFCFCPKCGKPLEIKDEQPEPPSEQNGGLINAQKISH